MSQEQGRGKPFGPRTVDEWGLNTKQRKFADEWLIDRNNTNAAIRAGYSPKTASVIGCELLAHPRVSAYLQFLTEQEAARLRISRERVLDEMAKIGFANIDEVADFESAGIKSGSRRADTAAIASVRVKRTFGPTGESIEREFKMHDKGKALENLGKHLNLFTDKLEVTGGIQIADARSNLAERLAQRVESAADSRSGDGAEA